MAHGPQPRDWSYKLNKQVRRLGLCVALSQKLAEGNLVVVDSFQLQEPRTKLLHDKLQGLDCLDGVFVDADLSSAELENFLVALKNLPRARVLSSLGTNVYDMLLREKLILTVPAVAALEKRLLTPIKRHYWE